MNKSNYLQPAQLLPNSGRAFAFYLLGLSLLCGLLAFYIYLSVQILEAEHLLYGREATYHQVNQQNAEITWRIGQETSLARVQERALALQYAPAASRHYVQASEQPLAISLQPLDLSPQLLDSGEQLATDTDEALSATVLPMSVANPRYPVEFFQSFFQAASRYFETE